MSTRPDPRPRPPAASRSTHLGVGEPRSGAAAADAVAVIVTHGMGQQAHFETLEEVAELLRAAEARAHGAAPPITVRIVELGGRELPRAEVRVTTAAGTARDVHLYESYWAPLTEGRVTTAQALGFLVGSGLRGMRRCGFLRWSFERYVFERPIRFEVPKHVLLQFAAALLVVGSLLAINLVAVGSLASLAIGGEPWGPSHRAAFADLTAELAVGLVVVLAAILGATGVPRLARRPGGDPHAGAALRAWVTAVAWLLMVAALASLVATAFAVVAHAWLHAAGSGDRLALLPAAERLSAALGGGPWTPLQWLMVLATWLGGGLVTARVRHFLIRYVGDVAAYVSAHTVSTFAEVRDAIQARSLAVAEAVYRAPAAGGEGFAYPVVVVVGHSLGSLIAYDALNALLVKDALAGGVLAVAARTRTFLTFGSPLDKTAFIYRAQRLRPTGAREALAAARQPMILDYRWRPARWVNIHSRHDWIGGSLEYYDDRDQTAHRSQWVENLEDPEATTPLAAHVEYWRNPLLADQLRQAVTR